MAIAVTYVGKNGDNSSPYTSGSLTFTDGRTALVAVAAVNTDAPEEPTSFTLSGCGQTWTAISGAYAGNTDLATADFGLQIFRADLSSPTVGELTATASTGQEFHFFAIELTEVTSGASGIVQAVAGEGDQGGSAGNVSVTLSSFADSTNNATVLFGFAYEDGGAPAFSFPSLTEIDSENTFEDATIGCGWQVGEDTTPDINLTHWYLIVGLELDHGGSGGGGGGTLGVAARAHMMRSMAA